MKHRSILFVLLVLPLVLMAMPLRADWPGERCAVIQTRHYYTVVHRDSLLRNIEVCLSATTKSVEYELPALPQPLSLTASDGATVTAVVTDTAFPDDPVTYTGETITFELPHRGEETKYRLRVEVPVYSAGVILGSMDGHVVGTILMVSEVSGNALSRMTRTNLYVALGGLWGEMWFTTLARPGGVTIQVTTIPEPALSDSGTFMVHGPHKWQSVWYEELNNPAIVLPGDWQPGGYFALRVSFPNPLQPTRLPDLGGLPGPTLP